MRFYHTISFRVLVGSCLLLFVLFGLYSFIAVSVHTDQVLAQVYESADRMTDIIKKSTHYSMMLNRREDVRQIITTIGREPGVEGIRIYDKRGVIMISTVPAEERTTVNLHAEACYACHDSERPLQSLPISTRMRTYTGSHGHRILGLINPIPNEPACSDAACHAHPRDRTVLGVLDIRMSLEAVDADIAAAQRRLIVWAVVMTLIVAAASGLFFFVTIHRPVQTLVEGTVQVSSQNLQHRIPVTSRDELGELARSLNQMTKSLQEASEEKLAWSQTLERRIEEKTRELKVIHGQILQIEKMACLGKLSATVAHELNNPLEGILTYAKLIAKKLRRLNGGEPDAGSKAMIEDMNLIVTEVIRCGNIVKNLLLFSKKQVGEFGLNTAESVIQNAVQLMQHHLKISNVRLEVEYKAHDALITCDPNQIQQALVALFVNAAEAMPEGGQLSVEVRNSDSGELLISVSDTGVGIPPDDLPNIFEPFYTTKRDGKGVGLGLSVVYGIMERHGGTVTVKSEPGQGTEFTIAFPPASRDNPRVDAEESFA